MAEPMVIRVEGKHRAAAAKFQQLMTSPLTAAS